MALQKCGLNLDQAQRELSAHGTPDFPCGGYAFDSGEEREVPWHWHEEIELIYVNRGNMKVQVPGRSFEAEEGDLVAVNSNILHRAAGEPDGALLSLVFHPLLVSGAPDTVFARHYMDPLTGNSAFTGFCEKNGQYGLSGQFLEAFWAMTGERKGFEFTVRERLSGICLFLTEWFHVREGVEGEEHVRERKGQDSLRVRKMLDYIHRNYPSPLTLSGIAGEAGIGERECLRCFKRTIQVPPMQYLLKYRIMQGAALLRGNPAASVAEIAAACGFDSPSNFSKLFRRFYGCTPREYRKGRAARQNIGWI